MNQFHFVKVLEFLCIPLNILPVFSSVLNYGVCWTTLLSFFLQVWPAVLLCQRTPTYYGRIVVKILYTPTPIKKNCAVFKNGCIHQCVQRCVYMYIVRTRFYTNFYISSCIVKSRVGYFAYSLDDVVASTCPVTPQTIIMMT